MTTDLHLYQNVCVRVCVRVCVCVSECVCVCRGLNLNLIVCVTSVCAQNVCVNKVFLFVGGGVSVAVEESQLI